MGDTLVVDNDPNDKDSENKKPKTEVHKRSSTRPKTKVYRKGVADEKEEKTVNVTDDLDETSVDPVVGWLVVIDGPGKGHSLEVKVGNNSIGRGEDYSICLDFGDTTITAKEAQANIIFDEANTKFHITPSGGRNLLYKLSGDKMDPILQVEEIIGGTNIKMGATTLRFVALCGDDFKWD